MKDITQDSEPSQSRQLRHRGPGPSNTRGPGPTNARSAHPKQAAPSGSSHRQPRPSSSRQTPLDNDDHDNDDGAGNSKGSEDEERTDDDDDFVEDPRDLPRYLDNDDFVNNPSNEPRYSDNENDQFDESEPQNRSKKRLKRAFSNIDLDLDNKANPHICYSPDGLIAKPPGEPGRASTAKKRGYCLRRAMGYPPELPDGHPDRKDSRWNKKNRAYNFLHVRFLMILVFSLYD